MIKDYFNIAEVVCPEVYHKFGEFAWNFFDPRLLIVMESIRMRFNKSIMVNNWKDSGEFTQRGFRCPQCKISIDIFQSRKVTVGPHSIGKAWDFDVQGLISSEVREYIVKNKNLWPYPIRLEDNVGWVHLDLYNDSDTNKVVLFNP